MQTVRFVTNAQFNSLLNLAGLRPSIRCFFVRKIITFKVTAHIFPLTRLFSNFDAVNCEFILNFCISSLLWHVRRWKNTGTYCFGLCGIVWCYFFGAQSLFHMHKPMNSRHTSFSFRFHCTREVNWAPTYAFCVLVFFFVYMICAFFSSCFVASVENHRTAFSI